MSEVCECGSRFANTGDSCQARFDRLLALDHSRVEPWGSRDALAFAAFVLQHPGRFSAASVWRSRELVQRVVVDGESLATVVAEFRAAPDPGRVPAPPPGPPAFAVTIADLGDFDAERYPQALLRWARAALSA